MMSRKELIYIEAAKLFEDQGYKATSMRDLASHVGIEASSLYSHIKSKADLLEDICFVEADAFQSKLTIVCEMNLSAIEKLREIAEYHIDSAFDRPTSGTVFNNEWQHLSLKARDSFINRRNEYTSKVKSLIQEAINDGEIIEQNIEMLTRYFLTSFHWLYSKSINENYNKEDIKKLMMRSIFKGLRP